MANKRIVRFTLELEFETDLRTSDDECDSAVRDELDNALKDPRIKSYTVIEQWTDVQDEEESGI